MIRSAQDSDVPDIANLMAEAFWDDDAFRRYFKGMKGVDTAQSKEERVAALEPIFQKQLTHDYLHSGVVEVWEDPEQGVIGSACWTPPETMGSFAPLQYARMYGYRQALPMMRRDSYSMRFHPNMPHWYLYTLAVSPQAQGKGVGSGLLKHGLERADQTGKPIYLEATTPGSQRLYARNGFTVTGEIPTPDPWANEVGMIRPTNN